jgi:DNA-binding GntR family transcriptional regulator
MPTEHVTRVSLSEEAYARIEAAIMDGTLEPGERLRDPDLIEWLGISRTPIRHALDRLAEQGLIEMERNRYTRVAPWDLDGVVDALQVAGDLWAGAAQRGLASWEADDESLVREIVDALREVAAQHDNRRFVTVLEHLVTSYATIEGNRARLRALASVLPQARRLGRKLRGRLDAAALGDFTSSLLDANRERDGDRAARLIEAYVARLTIVLRPES